MNWEGAGKVPTNGPRLGLLVRLFTASEAGPDVASAAGTAKTGWLATTVAHEQFVARLELASSLGLTGIELTQAGQSSGAEYLVASSAARDEFREVFAAQDLSISAFNCSGMPLHPVTGKAHQALIRTTILLAEQLGVRKIVTMSGVGGDGPNSTTINWAFMPWPDDMVALQSRQWAECLTYWRDTAAFAADHGIERIALELHPLHLAYNVPTLERLRSAIGPIIGATVDPSHLFWQSMDPVAVVKALGAAVHHVQLKDTQFVPGELALAGVLDSRPFSDPAHRAWIQRTIGRGHDAEFWRSFVDALRGIGYADFLSIENEDPYVSYEDGVREAEAFLRPLVAHEPSGSHAS
jgi:sugar phosphate isomerase/epimerase